MTKKLVVLKWKNMDLIQIMLSMIVIAAITSLSNASKEPLCLGISKPCMQNEDCCEGCCFKEKCVSYAENCIRENNPCFVHECPPNMVCYLQKVQCIRAPCPPIPACRPLDYDYN